MDLANHEADVKTDRAARPVGFCLFIFNMGEYNELLAMVGGLIIITGAIWANKKRSFWLFNASAWVLLALASTANRWFMTLGFMVAVSSIARWYRDGNRKP